jgi:hypothetical protein
MESQLNITLACTLLQAIPFYMADSQWGRSLGQNQLANSKNAKDYAGSGPTISDSHRSTVIVLSITSSKLTSITIKWELKSDHWDISNRFTAKELSFSLNLWNWMAPDDVNGTTYAQVSSGKSARLNDLFGQMSEYAHVLIKSPAHQNPLWECVLLPYMLLGSVHPMTIETVSPWWRKIAQCTIRRVP